ncbi:MAG: acyltransferase [Lachnospiraceae bacterium]|nr:acyltransferase [Lachnospiraceae bacterium]
MTKRDKRDKKMGKTGRRYDENRIGALDAVRAVSIIFIVWLHVWEQNWLTPYIDMEGSILRYIGIDRSYLQLFVRYGVIFVETLLLLSAVCNFIPYAKSIVLGTPWPDMKTFYKKRAIRVIPSYLLAVLVPFFLSVFSGDYSGRVGFAFADLFTDLTFTNIFFPTVNASTAINGVLWTMQVEFWFYVAFPFMALAFKKRPVTSFSVAWVVTIFLNRLVIFNLNDNYRVYGMYNPLVYLGLYANGFLITILYFYIKDSKLADNKYLSMFSITGFIMSSVYLCKLLNSCGLVNKDIIMVEQKIQVEMAFTAMIFFLMLSGKTVNRFCANRLFLYISGISYNLYLWHQVVMLKFKEWRIPSYTGDVSPNQLGDMVWSKKYMVITLLVGVLIAHVLTDFFEVPVAQKLKRRLGIKKNVAPVEIEAYEEIDQ